MKKKYLTYAGIVSALILIGMFIIIVLNAFPYQILSPVITIDPIAETNLDENNMLVLTGTTSLPGSSIVEITISPLTGSLSQGNNAGKTLVKGTAEIFPATGRSSRWRGAVNISPLQPADYTVSLATISWNENFTQFVESNSLATGHFTLGVENASPGNIWKKTRERKPFIRVNPIDQTPSVKSLEISGITSLTPGTPLFWRIQPVINETNSDTREIHGSTKVIPGIEGTNRWVFTPDNAGMTPGRYRFTIAGNPMGNVSMDGNLSAGSEFDIAPIPITITNATGHTTGTPGFVTIDALPDMRTNDVYVITGTTSLPPGEDLIVQVTSTSFGTAYDFSFDGGDNREKDSSFMATGTFSGATGMVRVKNGSDGANLWAFDLETYQIEPGVYVMNVSNSRFDPDSRFMVFGNLSGLRTFTIQG